MDSNHLNLLALKILSPETIEQELEGWTLKDGMLAKDLVFNNFVTCFTFMTKIAFEAEKMNHHPEWSNVYNRLSIRLSTHDAGGITELDLKLAKKIDQFASTI